MREGQGLAKSLEETQVFPQMSVEMIEVGESTGALPAMLNSISEFYEEDVQNALATAMALIEPVILIVMGVVVAFVLISLYPADLQPGRRRNQVKQGMGLVDSG